MLKRDEDEEECCGDENFVLDDGTSLEVLLMEMVLAVMVIMILICCYLRHKC